MAVAVAKNPTQKGPYDPVKAAEGMFNGSVARIAYVFKDPDNYGPGTKAVLNETSKRFQDALDDCEIQLLDAKWYLEHQLALNAAKREAKKAQEDGATAAKRKLEEMKDVEMANGVPGAEENPSKRQKVEDTAPEPMNAEEPPPAKAESPAPAEYTTPPASGQQPAETATSAGPTDLPNPDLLKPPAPKQPPEAINTQIRPSTSEGAPKTTPQDTPANEVFNFESVFDDPVDTGDGVDGDDPFNFGDLEINPDSFSNTINLDGGSSLDSLLPGLESYANQAGDDSNKNSFDLGGSTTNAGADAGTGIGDEFGLPDMGSNEWDALLNDASMTGGTMDNVDDMLNDNTTLNMDDFDNYFN